MQLSPRRVNQAVKGMLREESLVYDGARAIIPGNTEWRSFRKVPGYRLAARLNILRYLHLETPPLPPISPSEVRIPLQQHIGSPALALVKAGDMVRQGECIGEIPENTMGARVHASISGVVLAADTAVTIRAE
jgi:hypothetical protein